MKYTSEDFKNRKIAVWVRDEEEYGQFCAFARGIKWGSGDTVDEYMPSLPCKIVVGYFDGKNYNDDKMTYVVSGGCLIYKCRYKSVTMADLDTGSGK